jgi:polysaccharide transporter, PST family
MLDRLKGLIRVRVVRNILALYGVRAVEQLLPLVILPYLARTLEPAGWGMFAIGQAFAIYGIVVVEYGFSFSGTRAVASARDQAGQVAELVSGVVVTQLVLAGVVALAAVVARSVVPVFRDEPLLLWAGLAFAILEGFNPVWYFTGQERIPLIGAIAVGSKVLATIAIFVLVRTPDDGWLVLASYAGGSLLTTAAGYALILREVRPGRLSLTLIGRTLSLGASMFIMRIALMMHTAGNVFLLGLLVAPQQVAFFAAGDKLCRPIAWLLQPINTALLPHLSHLVGARPERAQQLAELTLLLQGATGIAFGLVVALTAPWLVDLLFGPGYASAVVVLRLMAAIIPLVVLNGALITQWMIPHGLDRLLNTVAVASTGLNLVLALILAPRFGAVGMASVTVVIESFILAGLLWSLRSRGLKPIAPEVLRRGAVALITEGNDQAADTRR